MLLGGGRASPVLLLVAALSRRLFVVPLFAFMSGSNAKRGFDNGEWSDRRVL